MKTNLIALLICGLMCLKLTHCEPNDKKETINVENDDITFDDFKGKFGKVYQSLEDNTDRKETFEKNVKKWKESECTACGITNLFDRTEE